METLNILRILKRKLLRQRNSTQTLHCMFLDYLRYATPGMCATGNIYLFDKVIRELNSNLPILEIGSWCGQSANIITYLLRKHGKQNQLFTCDGWKYEAKNHPPLFPDSDVLFADYYAFIKSSYIRNTEFFSAGRLPHSIHLTSNEFFDEWRKNAVLTDIFGRSVQLGGNFAFCFINGDHAYEPAAQDFTNCDAHLETGGFILLDDSATDGGWPGAYQVAEEAIGNPRYKLVSRNPNVLVQKQGANALVN